MKTAIDLIKEERKQQIVKHGFTIEHDSNYKNDELFQAASFCLELKSLPNHQEPHTMLFKWPDNWDKYFETRIRGKSRFQQLIIAGAFLMADDDRLEFIGEKRKHYDQINEIAKALDFLI